MATVADDRLYLQELTRLFDLPAHVLRRFIDRHGLAEPRRYPGQHRGMAPERLPELRRLLTEKGYIR